MWQIVCKSDKTEVFSHEKRKNELCDSHTHSLTYTRSPRGTRFAFSHNCITHTQAHSAAYTHLPRNVIKARVGFDFPLPPPAPPPQVDPVSGFVVAALCLRVCDLSAVCVSALYFCFVIVWFLSICFDFSLFTLAFFVFSLANRVLFACRLGWESGLGVCGAREL